MIGKPIAFEIDTSDGLPQRINLTPAGTRFEGEDGRVYEIDEDKLEDGENGPDIKIDVEHATFINGARGEYVKAYGWMKGVDRSDIKGKGVWGKIKEWTPNGQLALNNKDYRYISPVYQLWPGTRTVRRVISVALASLPNLTQLAALNGALNSMFGNNGVESMEKKLLALLGLHENATEKEIEAKIESLKANNAQAEKDKVSSLEAKIAELTARLEKTAKDAEQKEIEVELNTAVALGKITPGKRELFAKLAAGDHANRLNIHGLRSLIAVETPPVAEGEIEMNTAGLAVRKKAAGQIRNGEIVLTPSQLKRCQEDGIDPKDYIQTMLDYQNGVK